MGSATGWVRHHPGVLVLLLAILAGQALKALAQPRLLDSPLIGQVPLLPALSLAAAIVLALLIVWLRVRLGHQLVETARQHALSLPDSASLPKSYAVHDAPGQVTSGGLGLLDLALLLLVQATVLPPLLVFADRFLVPRTWADGAFVGVVVLIALAMLVKLWRSGGPVLVLLLWWALDRVVPTAGFLGARADVATSPVAPVANRTLAASASDPTVAAQRTAASPPTVAAAHPADGEATVLAEAPVNTPTVRAAPTPGGEATVLADTPVDSPTVAAAHAPEGEPTVLSETQCATHPTDEEATLLRRPDSA